MFMSLSIINTEVLIGFAKPRYTIAENGSFVDVSFGILNGTLNREVDVQFSFIDGTATSKRNLVLA